MLCAVVYRPSSPRIGQAQHVFMQTQTHADAACRHICTNSARRAPQKHRAHTRAHTRTRARTPRAHILRATLRRRANCVCSAHPEEPTYLPSCGCRPPAMVILYPAENSNIDNQEANAFCATTCVYALPLETAPLPSFPAVPCSLSLYLTFSLEFSRLLSTGPSTTISCQRIAQDAHCLSDGSNVTSDEPGHTGS